MYRLVLSTLYTLLLNSSLIKGWTEELFRIRRILQSSGRPVDMILYGSPVIAIYNTPAIEESSSYVSHFAGKQTTRIERTVSCWIKKFTNSNTMSQNIRNLWIPFFCVHANFPYFLQNSDYQTRVVGSQRTNFSHKYHKVKKKNNRRWTDNHCKHTESILVPIYTLMFPVGNIKKISQLPQGPKW